MATQDINANKDSFIASDRPSTIFGSYTYMELNYYSTREARMFTGFDITSAPSSGDIISVTLYIMQSSTGGSGAYNGYFERTSASWSESVITWNSPPTVTTTNRYTHIIPTPPASSTWRTFDVTNIYKDAKTAGNDFGIGIRYVSTPPSGDTIWHSKESGNIPYIRIVYYANYYVKVGGNDSLAGDSWANAWATINKAATTVADGSTVHIGFGNYVLEPATNKIAPQNIGTSGIYYLPETATTGGGTGTVSVDQN